MKEASPVHRPHRDTGHVCITENVIDVVDGEDARKSCWSRFNQRGYFCSTPFRGFLIRKAIWSGSSVSPELKGPCGLRRMRLRIGESLSRMMTWPISSWFVLKRERYCSSKKWQKGPWPMS